MLGEKKADPAEALVLENIPVLQYVSCHVSGKTLENYRWADKARVVI